ncbi:putative inactive purple acid phosphatase 27, partial [Mucuna pruriens]
MKLCLFVEWVPKGGRQARSPAGTLTFNRNSMCGQPARTVGWRDPGFIHTSFLKELWPNLRSIRSRHPHIPDKTRCNVLSFLAERDDSTEYANYQPGSLNTTDQLIKDLDNYDIVFHRGFALCKWIHLTVGPIHSSSARLNIWFTHSYCSGNHERDWPNNGPSYDTPDSGGECGVPPETMYYFPAENKAKFWYSLVKFQHSTPCIEYKKSSDRKVYDSFTISRDYRDFLSIPYPLAFVSHFFLINSLFTKKLKESEVMSLSTVLTFKVFKESFAEILPLL